MPRALPSLNRWHWIAGATLVLTVGLPLGITIVGSLVSLAEADALPELGVIARAAYGTAASTLASTLVGVAVGLPLAELLATLRGHTGQVLRLLAWLPLAVPPLAYALGVRRIVEVLGLSEAWLDPGTATLLLLPPVLAQSAIAIAVISAALVTFRRPHGTTDRVAGDDVARVLGAPALVRSWTADPTGTRTGLVVGTCLGAMHGLTSVAAPLAFPASAGLNLGATLVRGAPSAAALLAVAPLLLTLPLLLLARRLARVVEDGPTSGPADGLERSHPRATAMTAAIVAVFAVLPLGAVLFTGLGPVSVGALLINAPGVDFPTLAATTLAMAGAAALGAMLPFALSVPTTLDAARRSSLPWVALVLPSIALALGAAALGVRPLVAGLLLHLVLGFAAGLPVFHLTWSRMPRGALDSARVLGASTLQTIWWEDRQAFGRLLGAALAAGAIASLGDVTIGALAGPSAPLGLGDATIAFLTTPEGERGAFAFGAVLTLGGIASLLALEAGRATTAPMWRRP